MNRTTQKVVAGLILSAGLLSSSKLLADVFFDTDNELRPGEWAHVNWHDKQQIFWPAYHSTNGRHDTVVYPGDPNVDIRDDDEYMATYRCWLDQALLEQ